MNIIDCIPYGHDRAIPYKKLQKLYGATKKANKGSSEQGKEETHNLEPAGRQRFFQTA